MNFPKLFVGLSAMNSFFLKKRFHALGEKVCPYWTEKSFGGILLLQYLQESGLNLVNVFGLEKVKIEWQNKSVE